MTLKKKKKNRQFVEPKYKHIFYILFEYLNLLFDLA